MKIIYKYNLGMPYHNMISEESMPKGSKILDAQMHGGDLVFWAIVNPKNTNKQKTFHIYGTGFNLEAYDKKHYEYISTVQSMHGIVWHLFEVFE
jgi:hypothetical protein